MTATDRPLDHYRVRIRGHLGPSWSAWFDDLVISHADDGTDFQVATSVALWLAVVALFVRGPVAAQRGALLAFGAVDRSVPASRS